jgi:cytochrome c biogenesis protein CcmG/thiol:disulfide interchange protein DsbE
MRGMMSGPGDAVARTPRGRVQTTGASAGDRAFVRLALQVLAGAGIVVILLFGPGLLPSRTGSGPVVVAPKGSSAPAVALAPLRGLTSPNGFPVPGVSDEILQGDVVLVNLFATWCGPCHAEHPHLMALAGQRQVKIVGLLGHDSEANGLAFLRKSGNPYAAVSVDSIGLGRRMGATGYPTTFVLNAKGKVVATFGGSLSPERIRSQVLPAVERARKTT